MLLHSEIPDYMMNTVDVVAQWDTWLHDAHSWYCCSHSEDFPVGSDFPNLKKKVLQNWCVYLFIFITIKNGDRHPVQVYKGI